MIMMGSVDADAIGSEIGGGTMTVSATVIGTGIARAAMTMKVTSLTGAMTGMIGTEPRGIGIWMWIIQVQERTSMTCAVHLIDPAVIIL